MNTEIVKIIEPKVMLKLSTLVFNANLNSTIITKDKFFIDFLKTSFCVELQLRASLADLVSTFKKYGCKDPNGLVGVYALMLEELGARDARELS